MRARKIRAEFPDASAATKWLERSSKNLVYPHDNDHVALNLIQHPVWSAPSFPDS